MLACWKLVPEQSILSEITCWPLKSKKHKSMPTTVLNSSARITSPGLEGFGRGLASHVGHLKCFLVHSTMWSRTPAFCKARTKISLPGCPRFLWTRWTSRRRFGASENSPSLIFRLSSSRFKALATPWLFTNILHLSPCFGNQGFHIHGQRHDCIRGDSKLRWTQLSGFQPRSISKFIVLQKSNGWLDAWPSWPQSPRSRWSP